jgi:hypothetical protein
MKKVLAAAGIGAALIAGPLVGVGTASASGDLSYLQMRNYRGFTIYNTAMALASGYSVCNSLNYKTGDIVTEEVFYNSSWTDIPNRGWAWALVETSVEELCPWHDHRYTTV